MDSLTQLTLGAAVGEATLGKSVGRKAALWGAALGTLPDLDVLLIPFVSDYTQLTIHRGFSHSVFFAIGVGGLTAWGLKNLHKKSKQPFHKWFLFTSLALFTHSLLDSFTIYGTQLLNPINNHRFAWNSIFIIDPLYTFPLLFLLIIALTLGRQSTSRIIVISIGLFISTAYLGWGQWAKTRINKSFYASLKKQKIPYTRLTTSPTPFNSILWLGIADNKNSIWIALHGFFDPKGVKIKWLKIDKNRKLIAKAIQEGNSHVHRLIKFSRGIYQISKNKDHSLYYHDLRFLRSDAYLTEKGEYFFKFKLIPDPNDRENFIRFHRIRRRLFISKDILTKLWKRIQGEVLLSNKI